MTGTERSPPKLRSKHIYTGFDSAVGEWLTELGFQAVRGGDYVRIDASGYDRIMLDPVLSKGRVAVMMSHYPRDLKVIDDLYAVEARGFPCGPYLNGVGGVQRREYWWRCRTMIDIPAMATAIKTALEKSGLQWLADLHDPIRFAQEVDPIGALYAAAAYERAGQYEKAEASYREMYRRLHGNTERLPLGDFISSSGKLYLYVTKKLSMPDALSEQIEAGVGQGMQVTALPSLASRG
jgi:hypothetical protein